MLYHIAPVAEILSKIAYGTVCQFSLHSFYKIFPGIDGGGGITLSQLSVCLAAIYIPVTNTLAEILLMFLNTIYYRRLKNYP